MSSWLFSEDAYIKGSPSRKQLTIKQDLKTRESIYEFTIKLGSALKLNGKTILAATVYIARFYSRVPITTSKYFVVCAAITISCKLHDNYRPPDKIAMTACQIKNPNKQVDEQSDVFWSWRDQLLYREELMLKTLNFDLNLTLPYEIRERLDEEIDDRHKQAQEDGAEHEDRDVKSLVGESDEENEDDDQHDQINGTKAVVASPDDVFYATGKETLKQCVALIEILSSLPILVAYSVETFFGAALVIILQEKAHQQGKKLQLPKAYLTKHLHTTTEESYRCYKYVYKLLKFSESSDVHLASHRAAAKRIKLIERKEFFEIANDTEASV